MNTSAIIQTKKRVSDAFYTFGLTRKLTFWKIPSRERQSLLGRKDREMNHIFQPSFQSGVSDALLGTAIFWTEEGTPKLVVVGVDDTLREFEVTEDRWLETETR